ncbi:hypothetical protein PFICI_03025 [Pestalotiopsis fici W106-1]|uniref:Uncharacterized protein n=1 Tax=Pestalotiopsis fici (strain W106-1 / CGMCC3.15140) TaxID=1229662 RepID=W3XG40_PESFW|nr:uncharacterized protein PFICI_03025 [Pestalotiopsis fici W106-1]ETS85000.1 hypothetical protein PFICI_03025 [Pestalotiopsis fici W106-1]
MDQEPPVSQVSSHFQIEPISGSTLCNLEDARRHQINRRGTLRTGCTEIDEQVLVDGFERGAVVGISAEEIDFGLVLSLQTIAHDVVHGRHGAPALSRAAIITTLAPQAILPTLRDIVKSQVQRKLGTGHANVNAQVRGCLERISVSRVFDIEGLWEVLSELELESPAFLPEMNTEAIREEEEEEESDAAAAPQEPESSPLSSLGSTPDYELPPPSMEQVRRTEVMDSEDEGDLSSISPPSSSPAAPLEPAAEKAASPKPVPVTESTPVHDHAPEANDRIPGAIVITHFSTLLGTLFAQRDKSSAHTTLQLFSSHLRYLARSSESLIMLLNTTTNSPHNPVSSTTVASTGAAPLPSDGAPGKRSSAAERPMDPTLRSIFNPPPPSHGGYGAGSIALSKKNKPSFGLTFSQFLDLHLLCTRLPKTRADAEAVFAPTTAGAAVAAGDYTITGSGKSRYGWVVEVLLDESGFWSSSGKRIDREQRWGAVDVQDGIRIVDTFEKVQRPPNTEMFRLAAGFGGRRV